MNVRGWSMTCIVVLSLLLAACGGEEPTPTTPPPTATPTAETPAESTATPTAAQADSPLAAPQQSEGAQPDSPLGTPAAAQPGVLLATPPNADGYVDVTVDQLAGLLPQKKFTLVNVHIPYEGELPNTDLFIPFDQIQDNLDKLPTKDAPIVLYCRSGRMSTEAAAVMADLGYTNVYELDGGFNAWKAAGYELLQKQ